MSTLLESLNSGQVLTIVKITEPIPGEKSHFGAIKILEFSSGLKARLSERVYPILAPHVPEGAETVTLPAGWNVSDNGWLLDKPVEKQRGVKVV